MKNIYKKKSAIPESTYCMFDNCRYAANHNREELIKMHTWSHNKMTATPYRSKYSSHKRESRLAIIFNEREEKYMAEQPLKLVMQSIT